MHCPFRNSLWPQGPCCCSRSASLLSFLVMHSVSLVSLPFRRGILHSFRLKYQERWKKKDSPLLSKRNKGRQWVKLLKGKYVRSTGQSLLTLFYRSGSSAQSIAEPLHGQPDLGIMLKVNPLFPLYLKWNKLPFFLKPPSRRKAQQADHREVQDHWCRIQFQTGTLQTKGIKDSSLTGAKSSTYRKGCIDSEFRMHSF